MSCGCNAGPVISWYDLQNTAPKSPFDLIANAYIGGNQGEFAYSTTFVDPPGGVWTPSPITYLQEATCIALESDNQLMVADANQWNFRHLTVNLASDCCPGKPLPNDEFNDEAWRRQIQDYGVAWLDPNKLPTIIELLKALTQQCEGNDGKQQEYIINDIAAYLLSGEKPPCYLLQGLLDNVSESARSRPYSTFDKYFSWDPKTGKIYWRNPDGTRGEQANTGEESNWKCRGPIRESDGLYRYNCCG